MTKIGFLGELVSLLITTAVAGTTPVLAAMGKIDIPALTSEQTDWIGQQIYTNECSRQPTCLTAWNDGENFPSLGIGHFIWYQADQEEIYTESFPALMNFIQLQGQEIPGWIVTENYESPWPDRTAFNATFDSARMVELRGFLHKHTREQTAFIIDRFDRALADILGTMEQAVDNEDLQHGYTQIEKFTTNFYAIANSNPPYGIYALIDYVNFKGSGDSALESYQNQGWGLKQVLLGMETDQDPLAAFIQSARALLATRVRNAPAERNESRWLNGWNNRLDTYSTNQDLDNSR